MHHANGRLVQLLQDLSLATLSALPSLDNSSVQSSSNYVLLTDLRMERARAMEEDGAMVLLLAPG